MAPFDRQLTSRRGNKLLAKKRTLARTLPIEKHGSHGILACRTARLRKRRGRHKLRFRNKFRKNESIPLITRRSEVRILPPLLSMRQGLATARVLFLWAKIGQVDPVLDPVFWALSTEARTRQDVISFHRRTPHGLAQQTRFCLLHQILVQRPDPQDLHWHLHLPSCQGKITAI